MNNYFDLYVCPNCKGKLQQKSQVLHCYECRRDYPLDRDMPDFLLVQPQESTNPFLHGFGKILAPIYESPIWFPIALKLLGGWDAPSLKDINKLVYDKMSSVEGVILDVATGTGTLGRHIAGTGRIVYGIDISWEMLRKGHDYTKSEGVQNMEFARADGESLPFGNCVFDGCLLCGCLHIFPDTHKILTEVGRTLKPGAPVVVTTVIHGEKGIYSNHQRKPKNMKIFDIQELKKSVYDAGFEHFEPQAHGCLLIFTMRKEA